MLKRIFGLVLIIIAIIFGLGCLFQLPKAIIMISSDISGYTLGYLTGQIIFMIVAIFLFRLGKKWLIKKKSDQSIINQIGKE